LGRHSMSVRWNPVSTVRSASATAPGSEVSKALRSTSSALVIASPSLTVLAMTRRVLLTGSMSTGARTRGSASYSGSGKMGKLGATAAMGALSNELAGLAR